VMTKIEKAQWFVGIAIIAAMVALSGCGQTLQGVGKDIKEVGTTVEKWGKEDSQ
jgi:predicted small secreted protein